MDRKTFLQILGLTGAGIVSGCKTDTQRLIIPYVIPPQEIVPGIANWYASSCRECPAGCGLLVRCREGRAVKVEGNPEHPINQGKLCARGQATLQELYNPDRLITAQMRNAEGNFVSLETEIAIKQIGNHVKSLVSQKAAKEIAMITSLNSGSLANCADEFMNSIGGEKPVIYEAVNYSAIKSACNKVFGKNIVPKMSLQDADMILSIGADFLETYVSPVEFARQFADNSDAKEGRKSVFIYAGATLSMTGNVADKWIQIPAGGEKLFALSLLNEICKLNPNPIAKNFSEGFSADSVAGKIFISPNDIKQTAKLLVKAKRPIVMGGLMCDEETQIAIMLINSIIGAISKTVFLNNPLSYSNISTDEEVEALIKKCLEGTIDTLFILQTNPIFTMPKHFRFDEALKKIRMVVAFTPMLNETTEYSNYVIPTNTPLEDWDEYQPDASIRNYQQPVMESVFGVSSTGDYLLEIFKSVTGKTLNNSATYYDFIRANSKSSDVEWKQILGKGFSSKNISVSETPKILAANLLKPKIQAMNFDAIYFITTPSYKYYDGRGANKPWISEIPDASSSIVWENYVSLNSKYAELHGIKNHDIVELTTSEGSIEIPAKVSTDIEYHSVAIAFGFGHTKFGRYGTNVGFSPLPLLSKNLWSASTIKIKNTGKWTRLISPSDTDLQYQRGISQAVLLSEIGKDKKHHEDLNMYPKVQHETYRWGMTVDLDKCIGCGACIAACYAENNIPTVGKELISKGREMQWLRIERYREDEFADYGNRYIPMMCQHCENAPCEPVCPVYAAYHSKDGLNVQVYNRCIGTRYCSNNCPYKVRRFNWFSYEHPHPTHLQLNPDVTVRDKGVMEKCTFCVQRIVEARDKAKDEGRLVRDGEIKPACVQTCPTNALVFGNLLDEESLVSKLKNNPRAYRPIEEYNTRSAITYLQKVVKDDYAPKKKNKV